MENAPAWLTNVDDVLDFAKFGVVLMLFLVGLELEPKRLWNLRHGQIGAVNAVAGSEMGKKA